jgi:hypothetical protein
MGHPKGILGTLVASGLLVGALMAPARAEPSEYGRASSLSPVCRQEGAPRQFR